MAIYVKYAFEIMGQRDVERAMRSIDKVAEQSATKQIRGLELISGKRKQAAANDTRLAEKEAEKRRAIEEKAAQKAADKAAKEHERAEREKTRLTEQEAKKRARAEEQAARQAERAAAQVAARHRQNWISTTRGIVGGTMSTLRGVGGAALAMTGIGGGALVANAVHEQMRVNAAASGLANQMAGAGESQTQLDARKREIVSQVAGVKGASSADTIEAARAFGGISGNYALGLKLAQDFAKTSLATDVNMQDIGRLAGNTYMKLKTPGMSEAEAASQTMEAVRTFAGQGNIGAVEIKDLAEYGGRLTAAAGQFQGSRLENMKKMGTLAQVAVGSGSATDAAEATMAAARFASDLTEHASDVKKLSIGGKALNPFTDKSETQFKGIDTLIADIMQATGGNMSKMKSIFGERSYKMAQGFQQTYLDAERNEKGSGRAAVMAKFDEFSKATVDAKDVEIRAASRLEDADKKLEQAFKDLNVKLGSELLPEFTKLIPELAQLTPYVTQAAHAAVKFAQWFESNPLKGLAAIIGAAFAKELAMAGLGKLVTAAIAAMAPGNAAGALAGTAAGGAAAGGALATVGIGAAGLAVGIGGAKLVSDYFFEKADTSERTSNAQTLASINDQRSKRAAAATGTDVRDVIDKEQQAVYKAMPWLDPNNASGGGQAKGTKELVGAMQDLTKAVKAQSQSGSNRSDKPGWYDSPT